MDRIRGSIIDGRLENTRYRQDQLHSLHTIFRDKADELCDALVQDSQCSPSFGETEYFLAMNSIKQAYDSLDFETSLKEEYLVKEGKDELTRRVGLGVIAIRPSAQGRLYSIMNPLAMAIAARNCVFLELVESSAKVDVLVKTLLHKALDRDLCAITSRFTDSEIQSADVFLDGTSTIGGSTRHSSHRNTSGRSIAIVDRSANLQAAAAEIVNTRCTPKDSSPYSPDIVIVNEFVREEFVKSCLACIESLSISTTPATNELLKSAETKGSVRIRTTKAGLGPKVVEIIEKSMSIDLTKISGSNILILPSTGVVDTTTTQQQLPPHLATYVFAENGTAKFLSEQIASAAFYINQIPEQLLIGPVSHPHSLHPRFTTEMFSVPSPRIVVPVPSLLRNAPSLKATASRALKPTGQKMGYAVGFFEQGILIGLGTTVLFMVPLTGWAAWTGFKLALSYWR